MREALLILLVLLVLLGLTAYRYRRQIRSVIEFWRVLQSVRDKAKFPRDQIREEPAARGPLVNCQKCGKWVAEEEAVSLGRSSFFCSTKCLEAKTKTAG